MFRPIDNAPLTIIRGFGKRHRARRKKYICASDVPAILGLDNYRNALDVWAEKMTPAEEDKIPQTSIPAAIGLAAEECIKNLTESVTGCKFTRSGLWVVKGCMGATLDYISVDRGLTLQCKARGKLQSPGEPDARDIAQVTAEMICSETTSGFLSYLLGGNHLDFCCFKVELDAEVAAKIIEASERMYDCIKNKRPPELGKDFPAPIESVNSVARVMREPGKVCRITGEQFDEYVRLHEECSAKAKDAEYAKKARDAMMASLVLSDPASDAFVTEDGKSIEYAWVSKNGHFVEPTVYRKAKIYKGDKQ